MSRHIIRLLMKIKTEVFDKYILLILVPLGFIFEFMITVPFMVLCTLDNLSRKRRSKNRS